MTTANHVLTGAQGAGQTFPPTPLGGTACC